MSGSIDLASNMSGPMPLKLEPGTTMLANSMVRQVQHPATSCIAMPDHFSTSAMKSSRLRKVRIEESTSSSYWLSSNGFAAFHSASKAPTEAQLQCFISAHVKKHCAIRSGSVKLARRTFQRYNAL